MIQHLPQDDLDFVDQHCSELWEDLCGRRLFITGGTGFFGVWLLESLLTANRRVGLNIDVTVLTRNSAAFLQARPHLAAESALHLLDGDVRTFPFPEGEFPFVIHAATETWARPESGGPVETLDVILGGGKRVWQFAATHGTRRFLFTSSGAVYGPQPPSLSHIAEDYPGAPNTLDPNSPYAEGKRACEALCMAYGRQFDIECVIARCFAFVGPLLPLEKHFAIGNFIADALHGRELLIKGDGTPRRSYLYSSDLAIWLWTLLLRGEAGQAYNVGSAQSVSILEVAQTVRDTLAPGLNIRVANPPSASLLQYVPSVLKAETTLGLRPRVDLATAIQKTARAYGWTDARAIK